MPQAKTRKSKKREEILNLLKTEDLLTAAELTKKLKNIDRATIYRNLEKFVEEGLVREIRIKKGESTYEYIHDSHQHLICENHDEIFPVHIDEEKLKKFLIDNDPTLKNYSIKEIELNIRAECKE